MQKQILLILAGPVGSGKSSIAVALAAQLQGLGLPAAQIDVDVIYCMARQNAGFDDETVWATARRGAAALAGSFFRNGIRCVVVEGGFFNPDERADLVDSFGAEVHVLAVTLQVSFEATQRRIQSDPNPERVASRHPEFLRQLYAPYEAAQPYLSRTSRWVDAEVVALQTVVAQITDWVLEL